MATYTNVEESHSTPFAPCSFLHPFLLCLSYLYHKPNCIPINLSRTVFSPILITRERNSSLIQLTTPYPQFPYLPRPFSSLPVCRNITKNTYVLCVYCVWMCVMRHSTLTPQVFLVICCLFLFLLLQMCVCVCDISYI